MQRERLCPYQTRHIHHDYYSHEQRIKLALENKWSEIDKGEDHLAAVDTVQLRTVRIVQRKPKASRSASAMGGVRPVLGIGKSKPGSSFFKFGGGSSGSTRDNDSVSEMIRWGLTSRR